MPEPLEEEAETSWMVYLDRFDKEIYPVLFKPRGYTKGEAAIIWSLGKLENRVDALVEQEDHPEWE